MLPGMNATVPAVTSLALIVSIIAPYLTALVNQPSWSPAARRVVAVVIAIILGAATAYVQGEVFTSAGWSVETVLAAAAAVLVGSQALYARLFAPTAKALEVATSPRSAVGRRNTL